MVELDNYIPERIQKEASQVGNFWRMRKELRASPAKPEMATIERATLLGYGALVPDIVRASGAIQSEPRAKVVRRMLKYQVAMNDRLDFAGSNREDLADYTSDTLQRELEEQQLLFDTIPELPENEQYRAASIISTAVAEVESIEQWIRQLRDSGDLQPSHIDIYRNMVNAISTVEFSAVIFGPGHFDGRLSVPADPSDPQTVIDKYAWVMGTSPENELEQALMIMHNITMVAQIMDDTVGWKIDKHMNIPSYAAAADLMADGDPVVRQVLLKDFKRTYKRKVRDLGLGTAGRRGAFNASRAIFEGGNGLVELGRRSERARKRLKRLPIREQLYMHGTLTHENVGSLEAEFDDRWLD
jgi:hypothetical protein